MKWFSATWQALVSLFPFSKDGRATLIYIFFAGSVPIILGAIVWALYIIRYFDAPALNRLERFYEVTMWLAYGFLLGMVAYTAFVSIRALKVNWKEGTAGMDSKNDDDDDVVRSGDDVTVTKP